MDKSIVSPFLTHGVDICRVDAKCCLFADLHTQNNNSNNAHLMASFQVNLGMLVPERQNHFGF